MLSWAQFVTRLHDLKDREDGQSMVEYALILGLVSVVAIGTLTFIGTDVNAVLGKIKTALDTVAGG